MTLFAKSASITCGVSDTWFKPMSKADTCAMQRGTHHCRYADPSLEVIHQSPHQTDKVLSPPYVARHSFVGNVFWQQRLRAQLVRYLGALVGGEASNGGVLKASHQAVVLCFQTSLIGGLDSA